MISIYSDPHQGLNLASNTTHSSRHRLKEFIALNTAKVVDEFYKSSTIICAGDFYHTYKNSEEDIHASLWTASQTHKILAGNHDVVNIKGAKGSLDLIETMFDSQVVPCKFGKINYQVVVPNSPNSNCLIYMVPHHSNQKLFDDALSLAMLSAREMEGPCILVTHCNYDSPFIKDNVTLNMSRREAEFLLKDFDSIYLGHEHTHKVDLDGRLVVIGSPHPTGFGDISDKYVACINEETLECYMKLVWEKDKHYLECEYTQLQDLLNEDHQWVKLTGKIVPSEMHELASIVRKGWKLFQPFAIKSEVEIITGDAFRTEYQDSSVDRINEVIEMELKNSPELYELWRKVNED